MRNPIMQDTIHNTEKRSRIFRMPGVIEGLSVVIRQNENGPGSNKKCHERAQKEERRKARFLLLTVRFVKPKHLREYNKGDRTITGMKHNCEKDCNRDEKSLL